eukprot:GILI01008079.1.p1 GENE.GILI01008079.1~~GILI01008079.1.p1  ORF type:complete len:497 (+),score=55.49 GILI01008079.1:556-2046(+)
MPATSSSCQAKAAVCTPSPPSSILSTSSSSSSSSSASSFPCEASPFSSLSSTPPSQYSVDYLSWRAIRASSQTTGIPCSSASLPSSSPASSSSSDPSSPACVSSCDPSPPCGSAHRPTSSSSKSSSSAKNLSTPHTSSSLWNRLARMIIQFSWTSATDDCSQHIACYAVWSMDAAQLGSLIRKVLAALEAFQIVVHGLGCDGGRHNRSFQQATMTSPEPSLPECDINTRVFFQNRWLHAFSDSQHNIKKWRGSLERSTSERPLVLDGVMFHWDMMHRLGEANDLSEVDHTRGLSKACLQLTAFSRQDVSLATKTISQKNVAFIKQLEGELKRMQRQTALTQPQRKLRDLLQSFDFKAYHALSQFLQHGHDYHTFFRSRRFSSLSDPGFVKVMEVVRYLQRWCRQSQDLNSSHRMQSFVTMECYYDIKLSVFGVAGILRQVQEQLPDAYLQISRVCTNLCEGHFSNVRALVSNPTVLDYSRANSFSRLKRVLGLDDI